MSQYAYINESGDVLAVGASGSSLAAVQGKIPEVTERIEGAPDAVRPRLDAGTDYFTYHRLKEGAGGQALADYDEVEFLGPAKAARSAEVDARTAELVAEGFTHSGDQFPMDLYTLQDAHSVLAALALGGDFAGLVEYPVKRRALDGSFVEFQDEAAVKAFYVSMLATMKAIKKGGRDVKEAIHAAETKADLDAIVDPR